MDSVIKELCDDREESEFSDSEGNYSVAENEYNAVDMDINIANKEATLTMVGDPFLSHPKQLTLDRPLEHSSQTSERVANAPKPSEKEKDETLAENAPKVLQDLENAFTGLMQKRQRLLEECTGNLEQTPEYILVEEIFKNVPSGYCPPAD
ncbi:unnamed protein product, partial [Pocillopora meandrina]